MRETVTLYDIQDFVEKITQKQFKKMSKKITKKVQKKFTETGMEHISIELKPKMNVIIV